MPVRCKRTVWPTQWPGLALQELVAEAVFLLKASRPGFWATAVWFYLLPLGPQPPWHSPTFWLGLIYVSVGFGTLLYATNDITDAPTDSLNPRKDSWLFGALPTAAQRVRLPFWIVMSQVPFAMAISVYLGPAALLWFALCAAGTLLYNARGGAKDRPVWDVLAQCGYCTVFLLATRLNGLEDASWQTYAFGAFFAMHSHLFGQIMDEEPDRLAGRSTTVVTFGIGPAKWLMVALLVVECALGSTFSHKPWVPFFLAGATLWFLADALVLWQKRPYLPWQMAAFFLGWNFLLGAEVMGATLAAHGLLPIQPFLAPL